MQILLQGEFIVQVSILQFSEPLFLHALFLPVSLYFYMQMKYEKRNGQMLSTYSFSCFEYCIPNVFARPYICTREDLLWFNLNLYRTLAYSPMYIKRVVTFWRPKKGVLLHICNILTPTSFFLHAYSHISQLYIFTISVIIYDIEKHNLVLLLEVQH